ncbi:subtilisin DY [Podospora aff. communis PSN243]|uniref:Subtilisin DY n=1 Tax=Podospora aff. communis PSN243 TaxID=3040156 RepID=A0AAV9H2B6_9PEZI|nr:subtilisin DY [Podospora aff. communis PSN243]
MRFLGGSLLSISWAALLLVRDARAQSSAAGERFIIEFAQGADHGRARTDLAARNGLRIVKTFDSEVFSGVAVEAANDNIETLQAMNSVAKVWRSTKVMLEQQPPGYTTRSFPNDALASEYNVHGMTGVDKVHALGIFGKGVKIGVIDTGVDYTHPALGGCFGPGCKVAAGYDFIGNTSYPEGNATTMPDDDPLDYLGHGTHVTGIIAGKSDNFTGVAPEATIYAYKVFGTVDAVLQDDIIAGYLRAAQDGVDIITASLIGFDGWKDEPWALVGSRLVERGFVVVNSGGNYGESAGPFFHSDGASGEYVLSVASVDAAEPGVSAGGIPSAFTSWGALPDLRVKPDIAAPGGNILSTKNGGGYMVASGTSQSAPYIAGVAALWISQNGGRDVHGPGFAKDLAARIIHSGNPVPGTYIDGTPYGSTAPVIQVGNGIVDAYKVLTYNTSLSFAKFGLNDTAHFKGTHTVNITNNGAAEVKYTFGFVPSAGFELLVPYDGSEDPDLPTPRVRSYQELTPANMVPTVKLPQDLSIEPGETKTATFTFDYPKGFSNIPAYSGKIYIGGDNGEVFTIPYFGLASDLRADLLGSVFPKNNTRYPVVWIGPAYPYPTIEEKPYFNFSLDPAIRDYPIIYTFYTWGVHEVRWDIYESGWDESQWSYPPVVGQNGYLGSATAFSESGRSQRFDPKVDDENDTFSFPQLFRPRSAPRLEYDENREYWWLGKMSNGSKIEVGNYTMRYAALKPFGDPAISGDWDYRVWPFAVVPL